MGARSTGSHPTTTKADGHLLEYFRQNFGSGGGGTNPPPAAPQTGITATGGIIGGEDFRTGAWQGYLDEDVDATVNLSAPKVLE